MTVETVVITSCWWRGCSVICRWWPRPSTGTAPSLCHGEAGVRLQSPSSRPSNPLPYPASCTARAAGDGRECPLIYCVMGPVNSCWTCSHARNIGRYNSSQYNSITIHPVSVPLRYQSDNHPFSTQQC